MAPGDTAPRHITLSREVRTDLGLIARGTVLLAVPSLDDGWQVELSLPREGVPSHPFSVPAQCVSKGKTMLDSIHAHHDYRFAREVLGLSHSQALAWIRHGYRTSERQLFRWGFSNPNTEAAA